MSNMSDLDIQMREAGIDHSNMTLEEAIDLLRTVEVDMALAEDCMECEAPELGIMLIQQRTGWDYDAYYCNHRCRLAMPEHIAAEVLGLEETCDA